MAKIMNERIEQLAEQAGIDFFGDHGLEATQANLQEFAELIVRECAGVAWGIYANQEIANGIKQHFGVE